ncbi:MAG: TIGR02117 family protein [Spirosomataceae bacterium]
MLLHLLKLGRYFLLTALGILLFLALYILAAYLLSRVPINKANIGQAKGIDIYILTNGVHTDLVLPIKTQFMDWSQHVKYGHTIANDSLMNYLGFGWGDKGFYLETPSWSELKFSVAFKAMFFLSTSAMHTTFHKQLTESETCKRIRISESAYLKLIDYVRGSFQQDSVGNIIHIKGHSYGQNDCFYEANGIYNLFHTCNTWANNGLKSCGLRSCLWTPFDKGIFYQYEDVPLNRYSL